MRLALPGYYWPSGLLLCALALMAAAAVGPWLEFPLSAPLRPLANDSLRPWLLAYLGVLAVALIAYVCRWAIIGFITTVVLVLIPIGIFVAAWGMDTPWLELYRSESESRLLVTQLFAQHSWPNHHSEPGIPLIAEVSSLYERFLLVYGMMAWGWFAALSGATLYVLSNLLQPPLRFTTLCACGTALIVLCSAVIPVLRSNWHQHEGAHQLVLGQPVSALGNFKNALARDAQLKHNRNFAMQISSAYFQIDASLPEAQLFAVHSLTKTSFKPGRGALTPADDALLFAKLTQYRSQRQPTRHSAEEKQHFVQQLPQVHLSRELARLNWASANLALSRGDLVRALSQASRIDSQQLPLPTQILLAINYRELGQLGEAKHLLAATAGTIRNASIAANILCGLAGVYAHQEDALTARRYYNACLDSDSLWNYHAVRALAGM